MKLSRYAAAFLAIAAIAAAVAWPIYRERADQRHLQAAVKTYRDRAVRGDAGAQYQLGEACRDGRGAPHDDAQAVLWYRKAADQGYAPAQRALGTASYYGKGAAKDSAEAVRWWRLAADGGDAKAQCNLAGAYARGDGVPQDYAEALRWYRKAANQGDANGEYGVGFLYNVGLGVPLNQAEALRWTREAAGHGSSEAQSVLGGIYFRGEGVPRDYRQALTWYRKAAEQGEPSAQYGLCYMYHYAKGVSHDDVTAFRWCYRAADQGDPIPQEIVGHMYRFGEGVGQNAVRAYMWISLAAAKAGAEQKERCLRELDLLEPKMTPAQIAEAKRLAAVWKPKSPDSASDPAPGSLAGIAQTYLPRRGTLVLFLLLGVSTLLPMRVWRGAVRLPLALTSAAAATLFVHLLLLPESLVQRYAQGPFWPIYTGVGRPVFLTLAAAVAALYAWAAIRGLKPEPAGAASGPA